VNRAKGVSWLPMLALALTCPVTSCGNTPGTAGKVLRLLNNTSVTVTVQYCTFAQALAQQCPSASKNMLAPQESADFPLSSGAAGSSPNLLVITGYGGQTRCFVVPGSYLPKDALVNVTDAAAEMCAGRL